MPNCRNCKSPIQTKHYCDDVCRNKYDVRNSIKLFSGCQVGIHYIVCKECGLFGKDLARHALTKHNLSVADYKKKHNVSDMKCDELLQKCKNGGLSPFSKNFVGYENSDDKNELAKSKSKEVYDQTLANPINRSSTIEYYLNKGYTLEESKLLLSERQNTAKVK
jgi:hypothetical protein